MDTQDFDLSSYAVDSGGIQQAYYIPDFISEYEEEYLLRQIYNAPKPKWKNLENRRLQVWGGDLTSSNKLLAQTLPPFLTKYPDVIGRLQSTGIFSTSKHGAPNHVIVNEYLPLQGIMPHEDGPSYHPVVATISLRSYTVFHYYQYKANAPSAAPSPGAATPGNAQASDADHAQESGETIPRIQITGDIELEKSSPEMDKGRGGRVIDMSRPVLSLLLEPRSLVITTCELYRDHLHGIDAVDKDVFLPAQSVPEDSPSHDDDVNGAEPGVRVANWDMIKDPKMREVATNGGSLSRGERISLTCRDVESVVSVKSLR